MPRIKFVNESKIQRTARVAQLEGLFDVAPSAISTVSYDLEIPIETFDWNIGVIVGPSGSGKTSIARQLFGDQFDPTFKWDQSKTIVDCFPEAMSIKEITALLSSVGFSSPPNWLRPFHVLSNGEQFRVSIARALAENPETIVIDEFTSVVDRTVAQIGSAAIAKTVRKRNQKFVAVACHYDILEWLQPDWIFDPSTSRFARDCLQRPQITLSIQPVSSKKYWPIFSKYHYLNSNIHPGSKAFCAFYNGRPVAFTAVLTMPCPQGTRWKEHRTVCLPDFQGIGIGNAMSNFIASCFHGTKNRHYLSTTANPAMVAYRAKSDLWNMTRPPKNNCDQRQRRNLKANSAAMTAWRKGLGTDRIIASFRYCGPSNPDAAAVLGIK
jgi:ABC-type phosphate/phosphonate transport system ATPase subunit